MIDMSEWKEIKLSDVIFTNQNSISKNYSFTKIMYLDTGSITEGRIEKYQDYGIENAPSRAKRLVKENDIIYSTVRPINRHYGYITNPPENLVVSTGFTVITCNEEKIISKYLYYYLSSEESVEFLHSIAEGSTSTYPSLKPSDLEALEIYLPTDLSEQKQIAEILTSLDDKIDLLHRQNKTLEAMAETLFREWFVEGEQSKKYRFAELVYSVSIKHSFNKEKIIFLNTSDVYNGKVLHHNYSEVKGLPGQAKKSIKKDDILFTEIRPANKRFAYINFDADDYVVSTKLMVLRSKNVLETSIIYLFLKQKKTLTFLQMLAESRSGTFPQITFDHLKTVNIYVPKDDVLLNKTKSIFNDVLEKTFTNQTQIQTLEKLRDTLLPKLMSGEIKVVENE